MNGNHLIVAYLVGLGFGLASAGQVYWGAVTLIGAVIVLIFCTAPESWGL
jgi:hypothetical protein